MLLFLLDSTCSSSLTVHDIELNAYSVFFFFFLRFYSSLFITLFLVDGGVISSMAKFLGLGGLGFQGMRILVRKLSLYTTLEGVHPSACLPSIVDVRTNEKLLVNEF